MASLDSKQHRNPQINQQIVDVTEASLTIPVENLHTFNHTTRCAHFLNLLLFLNCTTIHLDFLRNDAYIGNTASFLL